MNSWLIAAIVWFLCGMVGAGFMLANAHDLSPSEYRACRWQYRGSAWVAALLGPITLGVAILGAPARGHGWRMW